MTAPLVCPRCYQNFIPATPDEKLCYFCQHEKPDPMEQRDREARERRREIEKRANRKYAQRHKAAIAAQDHVG
jgi:hypothetical protein